MWRREVKGVQEGRYGAVINGSVMVGSVMVGSVMHSPRGMQGSCWWDGSCLGSYVGTHFPSTLPLQVAHVLTQGAEQEMDR